MRLLQRPMARDMMARHWIGTDAASTLQGGGEEEVRRLGGGRGEGGGGRIMR